VQKLGNQSPVVAYHGNFVSLLLDEEGHIQREDLGLGRRMGY
jgi:hypothetical protein